MNDRWAEVERILESALGRAAHERAGFIAGACGADDELRREVESLLAHETATDAFLSTPAAALFAASHDAATLIGRQFGPYTILELLGSGGMGQVYRARDGELDRDVAIKIVLPLFAGDSVRLARFEREAKILAALNHPHIGAIYGLERITPAVDSEHAVPALVLELVSGPTLAERLLNGPLAVKDAIAIAIQIIDALEAAHRQGIIHRDLKPANIKVTDATRVKLLDFGIAKAFEPDQPATAAESETTSPTASRPGAIMGTAAYMSPEQARGESVDARSDLFSFGAVVYEMITGRRAFSGETWPAVRSSILTEMPPSPRTINPHVVSELDRIVMRLLAKDRNDRYQYASDVRVDLEQLAGESPAHPWRRWAVGSAAAAGAALIGLGVWTVRPPASIARGAREYTQITYLTDSAVSPALSSDGRLLTFIRGTSTFNGQGQIYVKALPDGEPVQLTSDRLAKMDPVFSPDNASIAYTTLTSQFLWDTWIVPVRGGEARRWLQNASGLSWLRDGRLMFSEQTGGLHMKVTVADAQRTSARVMYSPAVEHGMAHRSSVSPNGAWVLVAEMDSPVWLRCRLVPSDGHEAGRQVGPDGQCTSAAWSPDGKWMYFSANGTGAFHLWRQLFPDGPPEQLTFGPTEEEGIAPDPDGRSVLTSVGTRHQSIWLHDARGEREISREGYAFIPMLPNGSTSQPLTADGRSMFYLVRQGAVRFAGPGERAGELWSTDLETGRHRAILPGRQVIGYDVSHDGRQLVFAALDERGIPHVWLTPLDRPEAARQLVEFEADSPRFAANGDIFCRGVDGGARFIFRLREGRVPEKVSEQPVMFFETTSPDGAWVIAKVLPADREDGYQVTKAFSTAGGPPVVLCGNCTVDWTPSGTSLVLRFLPGDPAAPGRTFLLTLESPSMLPRWPARGVRAPEDLTSLPIARAFNGWVYPADTGSTYGVARLTTQRNIHRVPLP